MSADISKMNPTPAPLLAPLDRVYSKSGEYLGMLSEEGVFIDHEEITLNFMFRSPLKYDINVTFFVDNADHVV